MSKALAYFVTPHGFGHAARACAVIEAIAARCHDLRVELFTTVPRWFFHESLPISFGYHSCACDVGLVQATPLTENLETTAQSLRAQLPYPEGLLAALAHTVRSLGCRAVVCDVSAMGVAVAARAALPSLIVENFTWDWLYSAFAGQDPAFAAAASYLGGILATANRRIQTEPVCAPCPEGVQVPPVWRQPRRPADETRRQLGISIGQRMVLLTMGGIPWRWDDLERLKGHREAVFVVPGGAEVGRREDSVWLLPHRTGFYHPDLVLAADVVVGKLGYSTVAEVVGMGKPFAFVPRPTFPESPVLEGYLRRRGACLAILPHRLAELDWVEEVVALAELQGVPAGPSNGAEVVAQAILEAVFSHQEQP